jgi:hypothetical protein
VRPEPSKHDVYHHTGAHTKLPGGGGALSAPGIPASAGAPFLLAATAIAASIRRRPLGKRHASAALSFKGVDFATGQRYERPADAPPSWYANVLGEVRRQRVGDVRIILHVRRHGPISALLGESSAPSRHRRVRLENALGDPVSDIACEDIEGFTLLREPLDRRGELRGH